MILKAKILLLSIGVKSSYGGSLQTYALAKAIEDKYKNIECKYLQYIFPIKRHVCIWFLRKVYSFFFKKNDYPSLSMREFIDILKSMIKSKVKVNEETEKEFNAFWNLTAYSKPIKRSNLKKLNEEYDMFIVGSDQTWNCGRLNFDGTFFLDFVTDSKKKYSYAPSLSLNTIPEKYKDKYYNCLHDYEFLSCREQIGAKVIEELVHKNVQPVLDPVFLIPRSEWFSIADKTMKLPVSYVFVYIIGEDISLLELSKLYAKVYHKEIFVIYEDWTKNDGIGPLQWLNLIACADIIFTNSFHGTAFSIIFQKQFFTTISNNNRIQTVSSRITELLNLFLLQERLIQHVGSDNIHDIKPIEYDKIKDKIEYQIKKSHQYLDDMLSVGLCNIKEN